MSVISLLTNKKFLSLRWTSVAAFSVIIGLALVATQLTVTAVVRDFLVKQRINEQISEVNQLSSEIAPFVAASDTDRISTSLLDWGRKMGGRVLLLNPQGVVEIDSFSQMEGILLNHKEVANIRNGLNESAYGLHRLSLNNNDAVPATNSTQKTWCVYYSSAVTYQMQAQGILLVSLPVQDVMDMTAQISQQILLYSVIVLAITVALSMIFTSYITRPIGQMTAAIRKVSKGDFSIRIDTGGSAELNQLSTTFNMMSERLENLEKSRNEFLANASHELKTPLASMKILIESLLGNPNTPPEIYREFLTDINNEIDRLADIVTDLLIVVQVDTNAVQLMKSDIALSDIVRRTFQNLSPLADQKDILLKQDILDDIHLMADSTKLTQVIMNLVDNAIKYSPDGTVVRVTAIRKGKNAIIKVSDNGTGIPAKDLPHIFDRFYRVDKARSRAKGGTGLGLAIVKSIIVMHEGTIRAESTEGVGTVFTIRLPLH